MQNKEQRIENLEGREFRTRKGNSEQGKGIQNKEQRIENLEGREFRTRNFELRI